MNFSIKNKGIVNSIKGNPFNFFNSFSKNAHYLKSAAKFKKHFLIYREELSEIFIQLLMHTFEVPTEWVIQVSWWKRPFPEPTEHGELAVYGYWNLETRSIHINSPLITNPLILLNLCFHEFCHVLHDYRIAEGGNYDLRFPRGDKGHDALFEQCFRAVKDRFGGLPIERDVDLWEDL